MLPTPLTTSAKERDDWLVKMGWGLFLVGAGMTWLLDNLIRWNLDGLVWIWGGLILLTLNGIRYLTRIRMSKFTLGLGVILMIWGVSDLAGVDFPFFSILLIVLGAGMLLDVFMGQSRFKRSDTDYEVDGSKALTTQP